MWKQLVEAKIKRDKNVDDIDSMTTSTEFTCFKCKKINVVIIRCKQDQLMNRLRLLCLV